MTQRVKMTTPDNPGVGSPSFPQIRIDPNRATMVLPKSIVPSPGLADMPSGRGKIPPSQTNGKEHLHGTGPDGPMTLRPAAQNTGSPVFSAHRAVPHQEIRLTATLDPCQLRNEWVRLLEKRLSGLQQSSQWEDPARSSASLVKRQKVLSRLISAAENLKADDRSIVLFEISRGRAVLEVAGIIPAQSYLQAKERYVPGRLELLVDVFQLLVGDGS